MVDEGSTMKAIKILISLEVLNFEWLSEPSEMRMK